MKLTILMAQTADGKIAKASDHPANWTSKEDKAFFVEETKKHGVIIMGANTYKTIGRPLPGRLNVVLASKDRRTFEEISGQLEYFDGEPADIVRELSHRGFASAILGGGAYTNAMFLKAGLVEEILLTVEAKIFGKGISFADGLDSDIDLQLMDVRRLGTNTVLLHYKIQQY
ncbi:MAG: dihydrofolate reductase family protein [Patescibacteria group bacterium]